MKKLETDWNRVHNMTEEEIQRNAESDPDAPPIDLESWKDARVVFPASYRKDNISIRIDRDILDYFKADGEGYQKRMHAVLRAFVDAQRLKNVG